MKEFCQEGFCYQICRIVNDGDAFLKIPKKFNDVAPILINGRTMLPARFVAENLGAQVAWDSVKQQVIISR
ncbi:MAG: copper amine oxidase N-terminal domain-containing protein [Clostridia bacterium]|nr:copper amine oxidase N-terminal domain-containing protein [Clostridia bacterium]